MRAGLIEDAIKTAEGIPDPQSRLILLLSVWNIADNETTVVEVQRPFDRVPEDLSARFAPLVTMPLIGLPGGHVGPSNRDDRPR